MIPGMVKDGGSGPVERRLRSRLDDYADMAERGGRMEELPACDPSSASSGATPELPTGAAPSHPTRQPVDAPGGSAEYALARDRLAFPALLGEFRRTPVLVPLVLTGGEDSGAPLVADFAGIRWIYAFSDESALARFAIARGEGTQEWSYRRVLGARLLDAGVPATGVPSGVALDVGSDGDGVLFPPVAGIVPDSVAVDAQADNGEDLR
ncbi:hypothetical protein [Streptomyces sp. NPDC001388]|uniref:hypothetical protein n=1 Tax=Streptomyces sp. NPDC001388 TaxID=3364568 RepID=UPI0036BA605F